jgi:hypothetical protein
MILSTNRNSQNLVTQKIFFIKNIFFPNTSEICLSSFNMALYNFKRIQPVPPANDFLDIVLSKTQRKTPTVIHKNYKIGRIRQFYMRKVKFTQDSFEEKLKAMLEEFPKLDVRYCNYIPICILTCDFNLVFYHLGHSSILFRFDECTI